MENSHAGDRSKDFLSLSWDIVILGIGGGEDIAVALETIA
jgi:hypothetical protein